MLKKFKKNEKGFTLVELVVVIAILAVLAALMVPRIMGNVQDANRSKEIANARTLASEITVWNAKADAKSDWIPGATGGQVISTTDLSHIGGLPAGMTFPDDTIVKIDVDSNGNASIEIQP